MLHTIIDKKNLKILNSTLNERHTQLVRLLMAEKKVVFVIAHEGFQVVEYSVPKKLLEQSGITVTTASDKTMPATANDGSIVDVDLSVADIDVHLFDAVIFIGGPGAMDYLDNQTSYNLITQTVQDNKLLGAICIAPRILAKAGVLDNKRATGWNGDNELGAFFKEHDVHYKNEDVVVDDQIVTAVGPNAAREFAEQIISLLEDPS